MFRYFPMIFFPGPSSAAWAPDASPSPWNLPRCHSPCRAESWPWAKMSADGIISKFSIIRICIMNIFNIYIIYMLYNIYIYIYYVIICMYIYIYMLHCVYGHPPLIYLEAFYLEIRWAITPSLGIIGVDHGGWAYNVYIHVYIYIYIYIYICICI